MSGCGERAARGRKGGIEDISSTRIADCERRRQATCVGVDRIRTRDLGCRASTAATACARRDSNPGPMATGRAFTPLRCTQWVPVGAWG